MKEQKNSTRIHTYWPLAAAAFLLIACCMQPWRNARAQESGAAQAGALVEAGAAILNMAESDREFNMVLDNWEQALELYHAAGEQAQEASLLELMADFHARRGHVASAAQALKQAAALWHGLKEFHNQAMVFENLAALYRTQDMNDQARALYQDAITIYTALKDNSGRGRMMLLISETYREQWMWREALTQARDALDVFRKAGDPDGQAQALAELADMYLAAGDSEEAGRLLAEARALPVQEPWVSAQVFHTAGDLAAASGNIGNAVKQYGAEVAVLQESGDLQAAAYAQVALSVALARSARNEQALAWNASSLDVAQMFDDSVLEGSALEAAGRTLFAAGRGSRALQAMEQSVAAFNRGAAPDRALNAALLAALFAAQTETPKDAAQRSLQALSLAREQNNERAEAVLLTLNGNLVLLAGADPARALEFYDRATDLCRKIKDQTCETIALGNKGLALARSGAKQDAAQLMQQAITRAQSINDADTLWRLHAQLAGILGAQGNAAQGAQHMELAAQTLESAGASLDPSDPQARYPAEPMAVFTNLARTLAAMDDAPGALFAAERGSAFMASRAGIPHALPPSSAHNMDFALADNEAAVVYLAGPEALDILLLTRGALQRFSAPLGRDALMALARDVFQDQDGYPVYSDLAARQLHQALIEPVTPFLSDGDTLIVASPDFLLTAPFAALPDVEGNHLIQNHAVVIMPSLSVLRDVRRAHADFPSTPARATLAVQQQPACTGRALSLMPRGECTILNGSAALTYRPVFATDTQYVLGDYTTMQGVETHVTPQTGALHFETNCFVDGRAPGHASVVLFADREKNPAADTFTELRDMFTSAPWPPLVALPHCAPMPDQVRAAPGYAAMLQDLLSRGAVRVVATIARPRQTAAEQVMLGFYTRLNAGDAPAQALRAAQIQMINDPQMADPALWAPFIYSGVPSK